MWNLSEINCKKKKSTARSGFRPYGSFLWFSIFRFSCISVTVRLKKYVKKRKCSSLWVQSIDIIAVSQLPIVLELHSNEGFDLLGVISREGKKIDKKNFTCKYNSYRGTTSRSYEAVVKSRKIKLPLSGSIFSRTHS